jgi:hypothetical protein
MGRATRRRITVATTSFGKWTMPVARDAELVASASGFGARWDASGQIPERAVAAIGRFGAIDPTEAAEQKAAAALLRAFQG